MNKKILIAIAAVAALVIVGVVLMAIRRGSEDKNETSAPPPAGAQAGTAHEVSLSDPKLRQTESDVREILASVFGSARPENYSITARDDGSTSGVSVEYALGRAAGVQDGAAISGALAKKGFTLKASGKENDAVSFAVENASYTIGGSYSVGEQTILIVIASIANE